VDYSLAAAECARRVIVEINDQVPHTQGETVLHINQVEAFIETSHPLAEYPPPEVIPVHRDRQPCSEFDSSRRYDSNRHWGAAAGFWSSLRDHKDLGTHSELIGDSVIDLIEPGVIIKRAQGDSPPPDGIGLRPGHPASVRLHRQ
jgi:acyl-CoA hydrolase